MKPAEDLDDALRTEELRAGFLRYTREAYALIPAFARPRILDVGCGSGLPTIELARLSGGDVVGIDTDPLALARLRERLEKVGIGHRVKAVNVSLFETGLAEGSFDILWEEGVLHLLDPARSFPVCHHLLKLGGFLVMHETVAWFEGIREQLGGFGLADQLLLPRHCWWRDYYAPLEASIRALRLRYGDAVDPPRLAQYEREIAMVKADPGRFDCGFFVLRKEGAVAGG